MFLPLDLPVPGLNLGPSVSDLYSLNPDPAKNLNPDPDPDPDPGKFFSPTKKFA